MNVNISGVCVNERHIKLVDTGKPDCKVNIYNCDFHIVRYCATALLMALFLLIHLTRNWLLATGYIYFLCKLKKYSQTMIVYITSEI